MKKLKCKRCKETWKARVKTPVACPRCKSPSWNKNYIRKVWIKKSRY